MYKNLKLFSNLAVIGLSLLAIKVPVSAAMVTFELNYFDTSNTLVGSGEFSYDDQSLACFEIIYVSTQTCDPESPNFDREEVADGIVVSNLVTSFSADVAILDWNLDENGLIVSTEDNTYSSLPAEIHSNWYADDNQPPARIQYSRYADGISNWWFFGDPFGGDPMLEMYFTEFSNIFAKGTWDQSVNIPPYFFGGTWTASRVSAASPTAVPESSHGLGSLIAILTYSFLRQSKTKTQSIKAD